MGCVSQVFVWTMITLLSVFTIAVGLFFVTDGLSGRDTLATGPAGTFTAEDKTCGRGGCALKGVFTSDDGTIIRHGVDLRDAVRVRSGAPLPPPIEAVRLDTGADRPTAYTADYSWQWAVVKGVGFAVLGPVSSIALAVGTRRHQARAFAAHGHGHGHGH